MNIVQSVSMEHKSTMCSGGEARLGYPVTSMEGG